MRKAVVSILGGLCALALAGCATMPLGNVKTGEGNKDRQKAPACKVYGLTANEDYAIQEIPAGKTAAIAGSTIPRTSILDFYATPLEGSTISFSGDDYNISNSNTLVFANVIRNNQGNLEVNTNSMPGEVKVLLRKEVKPRIKAEMIGKEASKTELAPYKNALQTTRIGQEDFAVLYDSSKPSVALSTNNCKSQGFYLFQPKGDIERRIELGKTNMIESILQSGRAYMPIQAYFTNSPVYISTNNVATNSNVIATVTNTASKRADTPITNK
jgi:hypothetical protein